MKTRASLGTGLVVAICAVAGDVTRIKAVLFLDDLAPQVRALGDAFPPETGIELQAYLFTREAKNIAAFQAPTAKAEVTAQWERLESNSTLAPLIVRCQR